MIRYFALLLIVCFLGKVNAQTPVCNWLKNAATGGNSDAAHIAVDPSGNLLVGGTFSSPSVAIGAATLTNTGTTNIFLAKYDNMGNPIWAQGSIGNDNNTIASVACDPSGNTVITGYFEADTFILGSDTLLSQGYFVNAYIAKYGPSGNVLWARVPYSNGGVLPQSIATDNAGNIYVTGIFECYTDSPDYIVFGSDTLYNDTFAYYSEDIFLVKYSPAGSVLWAERFGGSGSDVANSVATDAQGNVYIAGLTESAAISFGSHTLYNQGPVAFVAGLDANGNTKWVTTTGPGDLLDERNVAVDKYYHVYFSAGYASDSLNLGSFTLFNDTAGNINLFVALLDTGGNVTWASSVGYNNGIFGQIDGVHMITDTLGNAFVCGVFYGYPSLMFGPDTLYDDTANSNFNLFVMEYDVSGNQVWATTASGSGNYRASGIAGNDSGAIYLGGFFSFAAMNMGSYSLPASQTDNSFITKLTPPQNTSVPPVALAADGMNVYPVPAFSDLHVALAGAGYSAVQMFDMAGRQVWSAPCNSAGANTAITIPTAGLAPGYYVVAAIRNGQPECRKVVVQ